MRIVALAFACLGVVGLIAASVVTLADVALRYWGVPIDGANEVAGLVITLSIACFFPLTLWEDHNLTISYLGKFLGGLWRRALTALGAAATLFFFAIICWRLLLYAADTYQSGETTPMARLQIFPVWWLVAAAFVLGVAIQIYVVARRLRAAVGNNPDQHERADPIVYD